MDEPKIAKLRETRNEAIDSTELYLAMAKEHIDFYFDNGDAKKNPDLVVGYMQTAAASFAASTHARIYGSAIERVAEALESIARALEKERN